MRELHFGVDIGGTKIAGAVLDATGATLASARRPNPRDDYDGALAAAAAIIDELAAQVGARPRRVGVGAPGNVDRAAGTLRFGNAVWLWDRPLRDDLARVFGCKAKLANDADCFALSEARDGAGKGASSVFGVILGTGVGGGFVHEGRLIAGAHGVAGEIGHIPMPRGDAEELAAGPCNCGRFGCAETLLSGPSLSASFARRNGFARAEAPDAREIAARADAGDPACAAEMALYEERLGRFLGTLVTIVEPAVIVLGGGLSNLDRLYENVPAQMAPNVFGARCSTRILRHVHGDSSGVRGAAWLWEGEPDD